MSITRHQVRASSTRVPYREEAECLSVPTEREVSVHHVGGVAGLLELQVQDRAPTLRMHAVPERVSVSSRTLLFHRRGLESELL